MHDIERAPKVARSWRDGENEAVQARLRTAVVVWGLMMGSASLPGLAHQTAEHARAVVAPEQRVDVNQATVEELMKIPRMKRTWAARIVRFRPYRTKLDLLQRGIVSSELYARIKDFVIAHREKQ